VLTTHIDFSRAQYPAAQRLAVYRDLSDRLFAIPGVVSVAPLPWPSLWMIAGAVTAGQQRRGHGAEIAVLRDCSKCQR
jgi:hypothetical protein